MAKKAYIGVNGVARKVKAGYIGVDGVARKIKKAYIGIGGVARPCWGSTGISCYGYIAQLSEARRNAGSVTIGNFSLVAGGIYGGTVQKIVDVYDTALGKTLAPELDSSMNNPCAVCVGDYALISGTHDSTGSNRAEVYDKYLTKSDPVALSKYRFKPTATSFNNTYALIAGGVSSNAGDFLDVFDSKLTLTNPAILSNPKRHMAAGANARYALFAGGQINEWPNEETNEDVDAYDTSFTRKMAPVLSQPKIHMASATAGEYVVFAGGLPALDTGRASDYSTDAAEAYDEYLTKHLLLPLSQSRCFCAEASFNNCAVFACGNISNYSGDFTDGIDVYDSSLSSLGPFETLTKRGQCTAAIAGNYMLLAAGYAPDDTATYGYSETATVEAYTFQE